MKVSKIDKLGLGRRIHELMDGGLLTSKAIASALTAEGFAVSQPTVSRWLKEERETRREETQTIVREHVKKVVPDDLDALEEIEAQCLAWAREDTASFAHRLAGQHIAASLERWIDLIRGADTARMADPEQGEKAREAAVAGIMRQCLVWIADDASLQKKRITAMRMASQVIDLKLRYSGIIDGAGSGNIFFVDKEEPPAGGGEAADSADHRLFVIKGGEPDA